MPASSSAATPSPASSSRSSTSSAGCTSAWSSTAWRLSQSLDIFTKLTIGDGLVSQIPAFIVSVAAGMLVTRSTGQTNMGEEVLGQLLAKPIALVVAAGFLWS